MLTAGNQMTTSTVRTRGLKPPFVPTYDGGG